MGEAPTCQNFNQNKKTMIFISEKDIPRIPGPSKEEWIPVDECLPNISGKYLCIIEEVDELFGLERNLAIGYFNPNTKEIQVFGKDGYPAKAIFWIPIPEIPQLEKPKK